tara:strand:- start:2811 stop:3602 length:792 start_codon:yes stop_codon:yes gene_type:complete
MEKVKWVTHDSSPMFLLLADDEKHLAETEWFKGLVHSLRWLLPVMTKADVRADDLPGLIGRMVEDVTVDKVKWSKDVKPIGEQDGSGEASAFINAILNEDWDEAHDVFKDWVSGTMELQLKGIDTLMPQYFNENWVVDSGYVAPTENGTMYCLKLEYEGKSHAITQDKALANFIDECISVAKYWGKEGKTSEEAADGAVFSMLNVIDGCKINLPLMDVVLRPHPEDKAYCIGKGEDYYIDGQVINGDTMLHEEYVAAKDTEDD